MTKKKKPEPNPIEEAIGDRTKPKELDPKTKLVHDIVTSGPIPQNPSEIPDVPSPQEMLSLEELNRQTEERLQDQYPEIETPAKVGITTPLKTPTPVLIQETPLPASRLVHPPVTKTSSPESPPQKIELVAKELPPLDTENELLARQELNTNRPPIEDSPQSEVKKWTCQECGEIVGDWTSHICEPSKYPEERKPSAEQLALLSIDDSSLPKGSKITPCDCPQNHDKSIFHIETSAEDIELTNLRKYILEDGFVLATVAFHIVSLCAQPMTIPSTTTWDFKDRAMIPDMVLALLNQPGYLEGLWPSLRIVMGSNKGNAAWTAGISTTIALFDVVRSLPAIEELKNDVEKKS